MKILVNNHEIEYTIRKSARARNLRLTVNCDASVVITIPTYFFGMGRVEKFLQAKADWVLSKIDYFNKHKDRIKESGIPLCRGGRREYKQYREKARSYILQKIAQINHDKEFSFNRIAIKNNKTRWGSCSRKGNLNFNYRLIFLPVRQAEYIIVHELCHLKEMNHASQFWSLVEKYVSDYKIHRRALRRVVL